MRKFKKGAVVGLLLAAFFVLGAFAFSARRAKTIGQLVPTAQTIGTVPVDVGFVNVPDNSIIHAQARIQALDLVSGKGKVWNVQGGFIRVGGVLSRLGHKPEVELEVGSSQTGQWEGTMEFDDVTDRLCLRFNGGPNTTIEWMGHFQFNVYQP